MTWAADQAKERTAASLVKINGAFIVLLLWRKINVQACSLVKHTRWLCARGAVALSPGVNSPTRFSSSKNTKVIYRRRRAKGSAAQSSIQPALICLASALQFNSTSRRRRRREKSGSKSFCVRPPGSFVFSVWIKLNQRGGGGRSLRGRLFLRSHTA